MKAIGDYLIGQTSIRPKVGIICGSGLGGLATQIENAEVFEYSKIPNFPVSTGKVAKSTCKRDFKYSKAKLCNCLWRAAIHMHSYMHS